MLDGNEPRIYMEIKDHRNQSQYSKCFMSNINYYQFTSSYGEKYLFINQLAGERSQVSINIHQNSKLANMMNNLFTIELSIIPKKLCAPDA
jgi:hypothetical protein